MLKSPHKAGRRKGRQGRQEQINIGPDVTLAEFADAKGVKSGRAKKGLVGMNGVNQLVKDETVESDLNWYERDLSEFDADNVTDPAEGDLTSIDTDASNPPGSPAKKIVCRSQQGRDGGQVYPIDVWFLISKHIEPEDVGRFAQICSCSHAVSHSAQFWIHFYQKYCADQSILPQSLQHLFMHKLDGLRTRAIRALFYCYPVFQEQVKRTVPFENEPDCVEGTTCSLMWYKQDKKLWRFYFKFSKVGYGECPMAKDDNNLEWMANNLKSFDTSICTNSEEGCLILEIVTPHFMSVPAQVLGQRLHRVFIGVGHGMRYHKIKLVFTKHGIVDDRKALATGLLVAMDPVVNLRILYWWDPAYPHSN